MFVKQVFILSALASTVAAGRVIRKSHEMSVTSATGKKLLSKARRLDDEDVDYTWMSNYSIKFDKCYSWEAYGRDERENRETFITFKVCPSDNCSSGCRYGGEYIVEMRDYVQTYLEFKEGLQEYNCEQVEENCECDDDAVDDDACLSNCYAAAGLNYCENEDDEFNVENYLECAQLDIENDDDGDVGYYATAYCSEDGTALYLGVFKDEECSTMYSNNVYYEQTGYNLPYSSKSIISRNCISCYNPYYVAGDDDAGDNENEEVSDMCAALYEEAGKCESNMQIDYQTTDACNYIKSIVPSLSKLFNSNGKAKVRNSDGVAWFFGLTTLGLIVALAYVIQTSKKQSTINLAEQGGVMT